VGAVSGGADLLFERLADEGRPELAQFPRQDADELYDSPRSIFFDITSKTRGRYSAADQGGLVICR
jgi:hypothetical protein